MDPCDDSVPKPGSRKLSSKFSLRMLNVDHWYKSVGCVIAASENCDQMYAPNVGIVQNTYALYFLVTCSLTTLKPSHCRLRRLARSPSWRNQLAISARCRCSWTSKATLGADDKANHHEHNIDTLGNDTMKIFFNDMSSRHTVTVGGDRAVLSGLCRS